MVVGEPQILGNSRRVQRGKIERRPVRLAGGLYERAFSVASGAVGNRHRQMAFR